MPVLSPASDLRKSTDSRLPSRRVLIGDMQKPSAAEDPERGRGKAEKKQPRLRLVLADDHDLVREETRQFLEPEFEVLRAVSDGAALVEATVELKPDAVVSDIKMPRLGGIEAGVQILNRGLCEAVVLLSMYPDAHLVKAALDAGIRAYVLKVDASEELMPAIYAAVRGKRYLSRGVRSVLPIDRLT